MSGAALGNDAGQREAVPVERQSARSDNPAALTPLLDEALKLGALPVCPWEETFVPFDRQSPTTKRWGHKTADGWHVLDRREDGYYAIEILEATA